MTTKCEDCGHAFMNIRRLDHCPKCNHRLGTSPRRQESSSDDWLLNPANPASPTSLLNPMNIASPLNPLNPINQPAPSYSPPEPTQNPAPSYSPPDPTPSYSPSFDSGTSSGDFGSGGGAAP